MSAKPIAYLPQSVLGQSKGAPTGTS